jgi:ABC-type glycerol-3-phosphate transport system substrate-binding protein
MRTVLLILSAAAVVFTAVVLWDPGALGEGPGGGGSSGPIRFLSLAWQEQALRANREIVARWNSLHPDRPVEYVQGTWSSASDYLVTAFETGDVPDVFHYESSVIVDFARRGYLADLGPMIPDEMREDVYEAAWGTVRQDDGTIPGIPFLLESLVLQYNPAHFEDAGIAVPRADRPWSWEQMREAARRLTRDTDGDGATDRWGVGIGLRNGANIVLNLSVGYGGGFFRRSGANYSVDVGAPERELLRTLHALLYVDRSAAPASAGQSGPGMIPGFLAGKYSMLLGIGAWARQQVVENAPAGFRWAVMPPLVARTQQTATNCQTLSIPTKSRRKHDAMEFILFMLDRETSARLARSDWMIPARRSCGARPEFRDPRGGWDVTMDGVRFLTAGPWTGAPGYIEWKSRVVNPILQELFANRVSVDEAAARIEKESNIVLSRYRHD